MRRPSDVRVLRRQRRCLATVSQPMVHRRLEQDEGREKMQTTMVRREGEARLLHFEACP